MNESDIFIAVLDIESPERRLAFLDEACGSDRKLRARIEVLLASHSDVGSFLEESALEVQPQPFDPIAEQPGMVIGPYKLLEQIGAGGMGVVFMAEQTRPVHRTVALKIIKPGMDTRQVIARFEAERQALAMMDHPNISRVLDAGVVGQAFQPDAKLTQLASQAGKPDLHSGRPYFVMDLVKGFPITDYCDEKQLTIRERLELMIQVCQAVQHAHQKGVIHRDLKPSNVMVAEYDGNPVPKVIDFGVAKATAQRLTERTMFTQYGQIVGTFEYMSPEQARFNQLDVDTRSDIYSLGVLLYELLTGSTPLERQRLETAPFDETLRIIREEEPPKPSTRLSQLARPSRPVSHPNMAALSTSATIAANRNTEPKRLTGVVRGELDWIVMKCLEKDRNRRYETASALAADIAHYLNDEPVLAVAPSRAYRVRKFIRRNKVPVIAGVAVLTALVAGTIGMAVGLVSQSRQRAEVRLNLANSLQSQRKYEEAETLYRQGLEVAVGAKTEDRQRIARTRLGLAKVVYDRGNTGQAEQLHRDALAAYRAAFSPGDPNIAHALTTFGLFLRAQHRYAEAEPLFREAFDIYRRALAVDQFAIGVSSRYLGSVLIALGKYDEAEPVLREGIAAHQRVVPLDAWALAIARVELGRNLILTGKFSEAETELVEAEHVLATTEDFREGRLALAALYVVWDQSEPGKGYDVRAREWIRRLIETFVPPRIPADKLKPAIEPPPE